MREEIADG